MNSDELKALDKQCVMQTYGRFDVALEYGAGSRLYSPEGKMYVDFTSGIGVNCLGYGDREWADVVYRQALKLQHVSNLYYTEPYIRAAAMLTERTGMSNVFFANGGGESNEGAIKLARKYAFDRYGTDRTNIVTLYQSFHGRTVTTLSATGQEVFHNYFFPFTQGFRYAKANDLESVKAACGDDTCAVMLELIQGEGGVLPLDYDFVQQVKAFCEQKDMLLIVDEVQTGVGRTGSLFAFQQYDILPDIVSFAKGIAGGLPFGGVMAGEKCRDVFTPGTHATTFGGNPIAAAAACHVLSRMTPELLESVARKGAYLTQQILDWKLPCVKGVRGKGLMLGVALEGKTPGEVARACAGQGLLILTAGSDALRMLPPLVITKEEMDDGLAVLKAVLEA